MSFQNKEFIKYILNGGVYHNVSGNSMEEILHNISNLIELPDYLTADKVFNCLLKREKYLSTAVGRGVAIPHCLHFIIRKSSEQKVCIVSLDKELNIYTPDYKGVKILFVILSKNTKYHIKILDVISKLVQDDSFLSLINKKSEISEICSVIKGLLN